MSTKIIYNKLVRDKIPAIIQASGKTCETEILSDAQYLTMLDKKLDEELAEYHEAQNLEELADLLEVLYAVVRARGYSIEELYHVRIEKKKVVCTKQTTFRLYQCLFGLLIEIKR
jgi:predicted house-cleaning noncanonical NTP pyrophosphatase (MazG superfamily)